MFIGNVGPIGLLWAPTVCILLSLFALAQFKFIYIGIAKVPSYKAPNQNFALLQDYLANWLKFMETVLGPPTRLSITFTHVLLVAILIAIIHHLDRIRRAIEKRP